MQRQYFHGKRSHFYGESACYTSIYVFDTKRRTTRFKVRKALNNKYKLLSLSKLHAYQITTSIIVRQENRS